MKELKTRKRKCPLGNEPIRVEKGTTIHGTELLNHFRVYVRDMDAIFNKDILNIYKKRYL